MPDYQKMYLTLTRAANKALLLNQEAAQHIIDAQLIAEEMYIEADTSHLRILTPVDGQESSSMDDFVYIHEFQRQSLKRESETTRRAKRLKCRLQR